MNLDHLSPREVVIDMVFVAVNKMPVMGEAFVSARGDRWDLTICHRNHRREVFMVTVPVFLDGDPAIGEAPRFVLMRLAPTVWKLAPSILTDVVHGYVTIVDPHALWSLQ